MIMDINSVNFKSKRDMKNILKKIIYLFGCSALLFLTGCDDLTPEITSLNLSRMFSPISLEAKVVNKTQVRLNWAKISGAQSYTVEVFADDSLTFAGTPVMTITGIKEDQLPYTIMTGLIGETKYSLRVKALGENIAESKWSGVFFKTDAEQIMTAVAESDIQALQVTLHWTAGETASEIILTTGTTEVKHTVTAAEIAAGTAIVTGLTEDSKYAAKLLIGTKTRGSASFTTKMDLTASGTIVVNQGGDLLTAIQNATTGSRIVIVPASGTDEFFNGGQIVEINKNLIIRGYSTSIRPIIHAYFKMTTADVSLTVRDVILDGTTATALNLDHVLQFTTAAVYGNFILKDCVVKNYNKSLVSTGSLAVNIASITFENCKVLNILTNSADCIDVRSGCLESLTLKNSTFANCAPARDFIRLDDASLSFPGKVSVVSVDHCTFNTVSNLATKRLLYVRFLNNQITFSNSVVANSLGLYTNQPATKVIFSKNDYFNAAEFLVSAIVNAQVDASGTQTLLDPGFVDAASGNLTITNATLLGQGKGASISW